MPLSDGYQTEKTVSKEALELAKAITEFYEDMGVNDRRGFVLFVCDLPSGVVQYMSDLDRLTSLQVLKMWVRENETITSNAQGDEADQAIKDRN
jgi:hypothetical protein